jgi:proline iminopeptidase
MSLTPGGAPNLTYRDPECQLTFARLVTHYWSQGCFLKEGEIRANMHRIADIPAVLIHGSYDVSGPLDSAWHLHRARPTADWSFLRTPATEEAASPASSSVPSTASAPCFEALR